MSTIRHTMYSNVTATFEALRSTFSGATIIAFGYPSVIDDPKNWCVGFLGIDEAERSWLKNGVLPAINDAIKDAADYAGVVYVDITSTTAGHGVCSSDAWINGARVGDDSWYRKGNESFHPNQKAHEAIASYFIDHYTDGNKHLLVTNPEPEAPITPSTGPEIDFGDIDVGAADRCGADCLQPAACIQACQLHVQGDGFAPGVSMGVTLQSDPVALGQVTTDPEGRLDAWFKLPVGLESGLHSVTLDGMAEDGTRQHAGQLFFVFKRLAPRIKSRFKVEGQRTRVRTLGVKHVLPGTRVDVFCAKGRKGVERALALGGKKRAGGCPFTHRRFRLHKSRKKHGKARLRKGKSGSPGARGQYGGYFRLRLRPGTVIRVAVSHRGWAGRSVDFRVRAGKKPKAVRRCTEPGLSVPRRC